MKLTKSEKNKIKKALLAAAEDGNVQAAKLLLGYSVPEDDGLERMSDAELEREKQKLLQDFKEGK